MANIMIRKASKDYICSCCGHIIRKGDEYIDKCIFNVGKIVKHDRYHDECPHNSDISKLFTRIERENGDLICINSDGRKIHIVGVAWDRDNIRPMFLYREWDASKEKALPIECVSNFVDINGGSII